MKIEGEIKKGKKYWAISVPLLLVNTQGRTKAEAFDMVKDAIELLINRKGFKIDVYPGKNTFHISSNNDGLLIGFALKQQRLNNELSIRDVVKNMGKKSVTAYTRYETGKHKPNFEKLTEILRAINPTLEPVLRIGFLQA